MFYGDSSKRGDEFLQRLRQLTASAHGFAVLPASVRRQINTAATLPDSFFDAVALLVGDLPHIGTASRITPDEIRLAMTFGRSYVGVPEELERLARAIRDTVAVHRADVGRRALLAYAFAKRAAKGEDGERLAVHLERMRRNLRSRRANQHGDRAA